MPVHWPSRSPQLLLLALLLVAREGDSAEPPPGGAPLERIAFGSCLHQDKPQPVWEPVLALQPELFLFLGDNIYGDSRDPAVLKAKYQRQAQEPGVKRIFEHCPVRGIWDDHDLGENDAGASFPLRDQSKRFSLDFLRVPADSPRRVRQGAYDAECFGPPGREIQVLLLDLRYFKGPLKKKAQEPKERWSGPYEPNEDPQANLLGEEQWQWLEAELRKPARIRLLISSLQVLADEHGFESWGLYPKERQRLFRILGGHKASGVLILSGDRHLAELTRMEPRETGLAYPLYDLTSSSLNLPLSIPKSENSRRVGGMYPGANFGVVRIDWRDEDPGLILEARGIDGKPVLQQELKLSALQAK